MAAAGVRTTKGLYFTFTLLCLVCLASSLIGKDQLEKLKHDLQQTQHKQDILKEEYESAMAIATGYYRKLEALKEALTELFGDSPMELLQTVKDSMENLEPLIEKQKENGEKIQELDEKFEKYKKLVEFLEENQAEL